LTEFSNKNGYSISDVYSDIASGLNFDRKNFKELLKKIMSHEVKRVIIKDRDRLTRVSFDMWKELFDSFNCELVVMNDLFKNEDEDREIFEDIISLLHCYAMRMYSSKRRRKLSLTEEDFRNEITED